MKEKLIAALIVSGLALGGVSAFAEEAEAQPGKSQATPAEPEAKDWEYIVSVYLWAVGLEGTQVVQGNEAAVDSSFSDIMKDLDFVFTVHAEAWKNRWGGLLDLTYINLGPGGSIGPISIDVDVEQVLFEFALLRRILDKPIGSSGERDVALDLILGGRYTSLDVGVRSVVPCRTRAARRTGATSWSADA